MMTFPFPEPPVKRDTKLEQISEAQYELHLAGLSWQTNNNGVHLKVYRYDEFVADFWPTTGKLRLNGYKRAIDSNVEYLIKKVCYES